jgi:hypothetical protein
MGLGSRGTLEYDGDGDGCEDLEKKVIMESVYPQRKDAKSAAMAVCI